MQERQFEDILCGYPELIEEGLEIVGRQVNMGGKYIDILFKDRHGHKLVVEVKRGAIERKDMAQLLDYEGYLLSPDDPTIRVMLVGTRVPENVRRALAHHGFEWKEIREQEIENFLTEKNDTAMLSILSDADTGSTGLVLPKDKIQSGSPLPQSSARVWSADLAKKFWEVADEAITIAINSEKLPSKHLSTLMKRKGSHNKRDGYLALRLCFGINTESRDLMYALADIGIYHSKHDTRVPKVTKQDIDIKEFDNDKNTYGILVGTEVGNRMAEFIRTHLPNIR